MSGWIKVDKDMVDDPRVLEIAEALRDECNLHVVRMKNRSGEDLGVTQEVTALRNAVLGALVTLWRYAHEHIRDDDTLPIGLDALNAVVGIEGFCELLPEDWLVIFDDGRIQLPGYCRKNNLIGKEKRAANNAARQAAWRARRKNDAQLVKVHNADSNSASNVPHDTVSNAVTRNAVTLPRLRLKTETKKENLEIDQGALKRAPTATRLPEGFALTPERRAIAEAEKIDAVREFANFTDHWRSASGAKARKHDWDATWRVWCRRAMDFKPNGHGKPAAPALTWRPPADEDTHAPK